MPARPRRSQARPDRAFSLRAPAVSARLKFRVIWGKGRRTAKKRTGERGQGSRRWRGGEARRERRKKPSVARGGVNVARRCQSKRFCFISFVFATETWSWREGRSGGEGGHCLIAGQDLFIPLNLLGPCLDGFDSKKKKFCEGLLSATHDSPLTPPPPPSPRSTDILVGILSGYAKSIRLIQNSPTPNPKEGRMMPCCLRSSEP